MLKGDVLELNWEMPNKNPKQSLTDATIQWLNSKSEYKIFTIFQGPGLSTGENLNNQNILKIHLLARGIIGLLV
ncbi:MAG: hypothetical protein CM15mP32_4660 [Flavobacteriaceae bacterium]|nr:MAG: hypothetical protein CM15mP32_4660 [Flavobacteriaceae bacterium]